MMKIILGSLIIGLFFLTIFTNEPSNSQAEEISLISPQPTIIALPPSEPRLLYIPKLAIYIGIENVGVDQTGKMETPQNFNDVGWYSLGFKPGEQGSAVMDGHLDTVTGTPAIFYQLAKLAPGDEIISTDNNGKNYTFVVTKKESYPYNNAPLNDIIYAKDKPRLNLITCDGTWDYKTHNYSNRIVIYSELEQQ